MNRLSLLFFLGAAIAGCRSLDRQQFQGLDGAGRAIEDALAAKADLAQYRHLLSTFTDELAKAKSGVRTSSERELVSRYDAAQTELTDILLIWEAKEARGSDMLPIRDELPARIAREYGLGINTNEPPSIYASEAMQTIWAAAKAKLDSAHAALGR